ncbi:MAG: hypothetical protein GSR80_000028 [Desulfurococcales archaeon]|nr:hypothetical protein [Desulfurococcales archaeon]
MGAVKARVKVYHSLDEVPDVVEPCRYIIGGVEVVVHEPVEGEELAHQLHKNKGAYREVRQQGLGLGRAALHALRT